LKAKPVLYPRWVVSSSTLRNIVALNPLTPILTLAQKWITEPSTPWPGSAALGGPVRLVISLVIYAVVCALAVWIFRREAPRIAEAL
jgi:ABC-type polysaccharide/polyol phosphate export permease